MALATYKDLCVDATDAKRLAAFWAQALDLRMQPAGDDSNGDYVLLGPTPQHTIWVNAVPEPRSVKQRLHLDVNTESVQRLLDLGATVLDESSPWTVMADPEGGELCAFVREGAIERRLYELILDTGDSHEDVERIARWWAGVLGVVIDRDEQGYAFLPEVPGAPFEALYFEPVPEPKTVKNRIHLDVLTADLDALVAAGATLVRPEGGDIRWSVMEDPDGNEFCAFKEEQS